MKELSLNILDITENSVKAGASLTEILIEESNETVKITIKDDGCGMSPETVRSVTDPFYTTRTTRKVGMGIPLLKLQAEQTGGYVSIESFQASPSDERHGTTVTALFYKNHLDFTPLGDVAASIVTLIQGHPDTDFYFKHSRIGSSEVELDTRELRLILEDVPLNSFEVITWIDENLRDQYSQLNKKFTI